MRFGGQEKLVDVVESDPPIEASEALQHHLEGRSLDCATEIHMNGNAALDP